MVSIIMAAYNAEQTIRRALLSCLNQTYKDIEVVVIDDASTDRTLNIVEEMANSDSRIRVVKHEVNKGAGLSRRSGINNANGDYITYLDSDDYLKEDCIETLVKAAKERNADIVHPGIIIVKEGKEYPRIPKNAFVAGKNRFVPDKSDTKRFLSIMLIKKELYNNVEYSHRRYLEDTPTLFKLMWYAKNVYSIEYAGYYYTQNPESLIHSSVGFKTDLYHCLSTKDVLEFLESKNEKCDYDTFITRFEKLQEGNYDEKLFFNYPEESVEILSFLYKCLNN